MSEYQDILGEYVRKTESNPLWTRTIENPEQFIALRDNYLYRTLHTTAFVASVCNAIAKWCIQNDYFTEALTAAAQNLFEETGSGISENSHQLKMFRAFDAISNQLEIDKASSKSVLKSTYIIDETKRLNEIQKECYGSGDPLIILSINTAQEMVAPAMLQGLHKLLSPFINNAPEIDRLKIENYFFDHISSEYGVEERHGVDALKSFESLIEHSENKEKLSVAKDTMSRFLQAQEDLWNTLDWYIGYLSHEQINMYDFYSVSR